MARHRHPLSDTEIEVLLKQFVQGEMRMDEGETVIQRFRSAKPQVLPRLLRMIGDPDEDTHVTAAELLMAMEDRTVVRPLLDLLDDPTLSDWSKLSVFSVLQRYDVPVDLEALYRRLRDPEAVARRSEESLLDSLSHAADLAQFLYAFMRGVMPEERAEMAHRLAQTRDPRVLLPLRAALHLPEESTVLATIQTLDGLRAAAAVPWLDTLAEYGPTEAIRQEAGKVAGHLTMRSSVPSAELIRELPALFEAQFPLHGCWLTTIDGAGGQIAVVARQRDDGHLVVADIMFTDQEGLRDCFGADRMAPQELKEMMEEITSEGASAVPVTLDRCQEAVERAYVQTLAVGRRVIPDYFAWDGVIAGEDDRKVETHEVEQVDILAHPELLAGSTKCLALEEMASWFLTPEEIQPLADWHYSLLLGSHISRPRLLWVLRQGAELIVDQDLRALLADRLRRQAWLLAQVYADREVWQLVMAAAAGLTEPGVASSQHPFLLGMIAASLDNLLGTTLVEELAEWPTEAWLEIISGRPSGFRHASATERLKLRFVLEGLNLKPSPALIRLLGAEDPQLPLGNPEELQQIICSLNTLESTTDDELNYYLDELGGLDWGRLRQELGLTPSSEMSPCLVQEIEQDLVAGMTREGCPAEMTERARRLWQDYILVTQGHIHPLRRPESWAAGLMYMVHRLYFQWQALAEAGRSYDISGSTVSSRYHALRSQLGVRLFSSRFSKASRAAELLAEWNDRSPEAILRGFLDWYAQDNGALSERVEGKAC